jgi:hypothetical protein
VEKAQMNISDNNCYTIIKNVHDSSEVTSNNVDELQTKLVHTLNYMSEWLTANGLKLNIDKTKCILN